MSVLLYCKILLRIVFVIFNNIYTIPTYCVWMLLFSPLKRYYPELYWKIEGTFFHWLLAMVSMWSWSAGYDLVEMGDDIRCCFDDRTLVISNHQSTADVPMLMATFNPKEGVLPNIMWIMDRVFKFTNFGIVSVIHEDFFILSGRDCREEAITYLKAHLRESYIPRNRKLMVLFPEGGFLRKRREASQRYALKNNLPVLNHVSLPRMGAMQAIIDVMGTSKLANNNTPPSQENNLLQENEGESDCSLDLGLCYNKDENAALLPKVSNAISSDSQIVIEDGGGVSDELSWVVDITVAYPEGKPLDLPTIIMGQRKPCQTLLLYRLYPISQVPREPSELTKWLFSRWEEKEKILNTYYTTGELPVKEYCSSPIPPQLVIQDGLRYLILHMFFITSSYLHFRIISYLISLVW